MRKTIKAIAVTFALIICAGCSGEVPAASETSATNNTVTDASYLKKSETTFTEAEEKPVVSERVYPDNEFVEPSKEYMKKGDAEPKGRVVSFGYETKNHLNEEDDTVYTKSALVYLPECYNENDKETCYDVLYVMHGGSDSPAWFLGKEGGATNLTHMLDCMISDGQMKPFIFCAVSYYTDYCNDDTKNCLNFRYELTKDLMPAFESEFHTYAADVTDEGFAASRRHRAFAGFSMGAVTTWSVFGSCMDRFAYFMPISGDCWVLGMTAGGSRPDATADELAKEVARSGFTADDFYIYTGCGSSDMAEPNLTPQIEAMRKLTETFRWCNNFAEGNLYQCICENGGHDIRTVMRVMYNGLPKMFG